MLIHQFVPAISWKVAQLLSYQFWNASDEEEVNILDDCLLERCLLSCEKGNSKPPCPRLIYDYQLGDFLQEEFFLPVCEELVEEW